MILTRIRERVRAQDWFAVSVELLIVVLGVFLGIQAANWNTERIEQETGRAYRQRILEDFKSNVADLENRENYFRQIQGHAVAALAVARDPGAAADEQFLISLYEASQIRPRALKRVTWDEILSTGAMNLLGSPKQRAFLSNYYGGLDTIEVTFRNITPYRAWVREEMPYDIQARVRERCPERIEVDENFNATVSLVERCTLALPPARVAEVAARLRADPELEPHLNALLTDLDVKITLARVFRTRSAEVVRDKWAREVD